MTLIESIARGDFRAVQRDFSAGGRWMASEASFALCGAFPGDLVVVEGV